MLFTVTLKIYYAQKMEFNREHFRVIIFYNFRHGLIDELNSIFDDEAPTRTSVYRKRQPSYKCIND